MVHTALLRVTEPRGLQRSTYYLQLPYLYAILLLIVSTLLHQLVSQNIFIAHIAVYERRGRSEFGHVQVRQLLHPDFFFAHFDYNCHCWSSVDQVSWDEQSTPQVVIILRPVTRGVFKTSQRPDV
jgi:hypothetical protein